MGSGTYHAGDEPATDDWESKLVREVGEILRDVRDDPEKARQLAIDKALREARAHGETRQSARELFKMLQVEIGPGSDPAEFYAAEGAWERALAKLPDGSPFNVIEGSFGNRANGRRVLTAAEFIEETDRAKGSLFGGALLIPGGRYLLLAGDTGVGKTIFEAGLMISLAAGLDSFLGFKLPGRRVPVLFWQTEGSRPGWRERVEAIAKSMGFALADLPVFFPDRETDEEVGNLDWMIEECGAKVVGLDPITMFLTGDDNQSSVWKDEVTKPLSKLARRHEAAFIITDHPTKSNEMRTGKEKIRGTAAKYQDAGSVLRLEAVKGGRRDRRILFFDRVREGAVPCEWLALTIDTDAGTVSVDETATEAPDSSNPKELSKARQRERKALDAQADIERVLREKKPGDGFPGLTTNELADFTGHSKKSDAFLDGRRALEVQGAIESVTGPNRSVCWRFKV